MSDNVSTGEHRDPFPHLDDEEYLEVLRTEEAVAALTIYLRQRVAGLYDNSGEDRVFEQKDNFPFPILPTAYEIAELVLKSAGSFEMDRSVPPVTETTA